MILKVNDELFQTAENISVDQLLAELNIFQVNGTAVAVNNEIVLKSDWASYSLKQNDSIIILKASQGG